jgi:hypothetical protein
MSAAPNLVPMGPFKSEREALDGLPEGWTLHIANPGLPAQRWWRRKPGTRVAQTVREAVADAFEEHAQKSPTPEPLDVWTFDDKIMTEVIPSQQYAVRPYFPIGCSVGLSGQGKVGKSYLMLLVMLSVAAGRACLGCPVQQGHVWYFSAEDRPDRVRERIREILRDFTPEERAKAAKYFHCINAVGKRLFFVASVHGAARITEVIDRISETVGKAVLVVIDTVSRVNPLLENNEHLALIVSAAEVIAGRTGAAVVLTHHVGKGQARSGVTDMYAGRGGSAFGDNCRSVVVLSYADEKQVRTFDEWTQDEARRHKVLVLTHAASSYGAEAGPVFLHRRPNGTHELITPVSDLLTPLVAWLKSKELTAFSRKMITETHVKEIWPEHAPSRAELLKFINASIENGALLVSETKARGGGTRLQLSPATLEAIEAFDSKVIRDSEGKEWDSI